jgi:glycosyltransferase involved in cell wall biosynthesis
MADHTARLAKELSKTVTVEVLVANGEVESFTEFKVRKVFSNEKPQSFFSIIKFIQQSPPDWVILQYNPFSHGTKYGINPYIPLTINMLKFICPQVKIGIIVHEASVPLNNWKLSLLAKFLKVQLFLTACASDVIFTVLEPWVDMLNQWFPNKPIQFLPVSSNIPQISADRDEVRTSLGISSATIVVGMFGRIQTQKLDYVVRAIKQIQAEGLEVLLMYIGNNIQTAKTKLKEVPLLAEGPFSPEEVSRRFAGIDIYLIPIDEGISTRNGSLMVGLEHGIPIVSMFGISTGSTLKQWHEKAFVLTDPLCPDEFTNAVIELALNPLQRKHLSDGAKELFSREFTWSQISSRLLTTLESFPTKI